MADLHIIPAFLTKNPCFTAGRKIAVKGLMLHSVGCPQPHPGPFLQDWNRADFNRACVHAFIDAENGDVFQTLPWNARGWHAGGTLNNTHIGIEMCEPSDLKYLDDFHFECANREEALVQVKRTYETAVELFASLAKQFGLDPLGDGVIISHHEGHLRGLASGHQDPEHLWRGLGAPYSMAGFRQSVYARLAEA